MTQRQRFNIVRAGYETTQVDTEILRLQKRIENLSQKIISYQGQIETVSNQFQVIKQRYQMIVSELSMREKAADDVTRIALKEANTVIETAQKNADSIINEAIVNAQNILAEVRQYNDESLAIKQNLKSEMEQFISILDKYDVPETPEIGFSKKEEM